MAMYFCCWQLRISLQGDYLIFKVKIIYVYVSAETTMYLIFNYFYVFVPESDLDTF